jgi:hypothetical protein
MVSASIIVVAVHVCSPIRREALVVLHVFAELGSVDLVRLKIAHGKVKGREGVKWSREAFITKIQQLKELADELKSLNDELRTFKYTIPNLGWMSISNFEPTISMMRPQDAP